MPVRNITRIDGHQIATDGSKVTRVHPTQIDRNYAIRIDRKRGIYPDTYGIIPKNNPLGNIEVDLKYSDFENNWISSITPYLTLKGPITVVIAPREVRESAGKLTWRQVMGYMEPIAKQLLK